MNSKKFLTSQLGSNINNNYTSICHPSQVETEEQLAFINHLHETIMKVELNSTKKSVEKDKTQTKLSFLKPPGSRNTIKQHGA